MKSETNSVMDTEESLKRGAEHGREAAEELLRTATEATTGPEWRRTRSRLGRKARALKSNMSGRVRDLVQDTRELGDRGQVLVREYPWISIGIGAGLGFLVGLLARRR